MRRVGIMGGTFDPIHMGHLSCAEMARDACALDEVLFVTAGNPNFKQDRRIAPAKERHAMVELAVQGNAAFSASDAEVEGAEVAYTADTLARLSGERPDAELFFIMGTDSLMTLAHWKRASRIAELACIICVSRPGFMPDGTVLSSLEEMGFRIKMVEAPLLDISSSQIRARVARGETVRYLVPDQVHGYLQATGLYRKERA